MEGMTKPDQTSCRNTVIALNFFCYTHNLKGFHHQLCVPDDSFCRYEEIRSLKQHEGKNHRCRRNFVNTPCLLKNNNRKFGACMGIKSKDSLRLSFTPRQLKQASEFLRVTKTVTRNRRSLHTIAGREK
ncbi:hypothetical protein KIN20_028832 [Parelaphostrongylus tenuis]|uniref:Uncharacterized protein n=1 Tax=Parelaphostrongylus tenuis TaxID=148309 RepID=A0AAD5WF05_PARTN|nr:hypothetical protein KIN20_028832 [Parelaphostrongylus tenuis]